MAVAGTVRETIQLTQEQRRQVESVVESALALEGTKRAEYLKSVCGADIELRREVESLLDQASGAGTFLEKPAIEVAADLLRSESPSSLVGRQIGPYRVAAVSRVRRRPGLRGEPWPNCFRKANRTLRGKEQDITKIAEAGKSVGEKTRVGACRRSVGCKYSKTAAFCVF